MSQLTPEIPFMASFWIRSGCVMKGQVSAGTCKVEAHLKLLIRPFLSHHPESLRISFHFMSPCGPVNWMQCTSAKIEMGKFRLISRQLYSTYLSRIPVIANEPLLDLVPVCTLIHNPNGQPLNWLWSKLAIEWFGD